MTNQRTNQQRTKVRSIPLRVLRDRGPLTINEAIAIYLVEEVGLTHRQAQEAMRLKNRAQIGMYMARAREALAAES